MAKKIYKFLLVSFVMFIAIFSIIKSNESSNEVYAVGNTYEINSLTDYNTIFCSSNEDYELLYHNATINFNTNITLPYLAEGYAPLGGKSDIPFTGIINGNNSVISNLTIAINDTTVIIENNTIHAGWIKNASTATIKDLIFENNVVIFQHQGTSIATTVFIGIVAGTGGNFENIVIAPNINVSFSNNLISWSSAIGGIVGSNPISITNSTNNASITVRFSLIQQSSRAISIGGIVGVTTSRSVLNNVVNNGGIYFEQWENLTEFVKIGGIAAEMRDAVLINVRNNAQIDTSDYYYVSYLGGIAGDLIGIATLQDVANYGKITYSKYRNANYGHVGGIAGQLSVNTVSNLVSNVLNQGEVIGENASSIGGLFGTLYVGNGAKEFVNLKNDAFVRGKGTFSYTNIKSSLGGIAGILNVLAEGKAIFNELVAWGGQLNMYLVDNVGGFFGSAQGKIEINKAESSFNWISGGEIRYELGVSGNVGGFIGFAHSAGEVKITSSLVATRIEGGYVTGGLLGYAAIPFIIEDTTSWVQIENSLYAGGAIGYYDNTETSTFKNSYTTNRSLRAEIIGGIIGSINNVADVEFYSSFTSSIAESYGIGISGTVIGESRLSNFDTNGEVLILRDYNNRDAGKSGIFMQAVGNSTLGVEYQGFKLEWATLLNNSLSDAYIHSTISETGIFIAPMLREVYNFSPYTTIYQQTVPITFDLNNGTSIETIDVIKDQRVDLHIPINPGHSFTGWYYHDTMLPYEGIITNSTTLVARWDSILYSLQFDLNEGDGPTPSELSFFYGEIIAGLPIVTRVGYNFLGWEIEGELLTPTSTYLYEYEVIAVASWEAIAYVLTLFPEGGEVSPNTKTIYYLHTIGELPIPAREGYTFAGWFSQSNGIGTLFLATTLHGIAANINAFALWIPNTYTITLHTNGGNPIIVDTINIAYDSFIPTLEEPTKTGYLFAQYTTNQDGSGTVYIAGMLYDLTANLDLYAQYTAKTFMITLDHNDGTSNTTNILVTFDEVMTLLPTTLTRVNYSFAGWYEFNDGTGINYTPATIYTHDEQITIFAQWSGNEVPVILQPNNGILDGPAVVTFTYGQPMTNFSNVSREGYDFLNWNTLNNGTGVAYTSESISDIASTITLYAVWQAKTYIITFDPQGGIVSPTQVSAIFGQNVSGLPVPNKPGFDFLGWNRQADGQGSWINDSTLYNFAFDITVHAIYELSGYLIHFDTQGGNTIASIGVVYNTAVGTLPLPIKVGHTFLRWNTLNNGMGVDFTDATIYTDIENMTLYAIWQLNSYIITLDGNTGQLTQHSLRVPYGLALPTISQASKTGFNFMRWNTQADGSGMTLSSGDPYLFDYDITLFAIWEAKTFTLTYDLNDGSSDVISRTVTYGQPIGSIPNPIRAGYTFASWNGVADGSGNVYDSSTVYNLTHNITIFAIWNARNYNVWLNPNGGTVSPTQISLGFEQIITGFPVALRTGYHQVAWNRQADGSGATYSNGDIYDIIGDTILYAIWQANTYTISLDAGLGNVMPMSIGVTYAQPIAGLVDATLFGSNFTGWNRQPDGLGEYVSNGDLYLNDTDMTLYAIYDVQTAYLKFDSQGGTSVSDKLVSFGSPVGELASPTKVGYTFIQWNTQANGLGQTYISTTEFISLTDVDLYAIWSANQYTITLDGNGINLSTVITVTFDSVIPAITQPIRTGYIFTNWNTQANNSGQTLAAGNTYTIDNDITLFAIWVANQYTLTLDHNDGTGETTTMTVTFDSPIGMMTTPTRSGYDFAGWFEFNNATGLQFTSTNHYTIANHTTIYASWTGIGYQLIFDANAIGATVTPNQQNVVYGQAVGTLPTANRLGHTQLSWNTQADGSGITYTALTIYEEIGSITLYAIWNANTYIINLDPDAGSVSPTSIQVVYGTVITNLVNPTLIGSDFTGWNTQPDASGTYYVNGDIYLVADHITLYAIYNLITVDLIFDAQGGTNVASKTVTFGQLVGTLEESTKVGYTFISWNTAIDGSGATYTSITLFTETNDVTLYAIWSANQYTITLDGNGISLSTVITVTFDSAIPTITQPTRTGYTFTNWNTQANNSGQTLATGETYQIANNITLFAIWAANQYTLTLDHNNGTGETTTMTVIFGSAIGMMTAPTRSGYDFAGWFEFNNATGLQFTSLTTYMVDNDLTIYASWTGIGYQLIFDANAIGATVTPNQQSVVYGQAVGTLPTANRLGHTQLSWNTQADGSGITYTALTIYEEIGSITLYAIWNANTYTINLDPDAGSVSPTSIQVVYGTVITDLVNPTLIGSDFTGWNTQPDASGTYYVNGDTYLVADHITLYAIYNLITVDLIFDAQGGTNVASKTVTFGQLVGTLEESIKVGYTFISWNTAIDGSGATYTSITLFTETNDVTLYAIWSANQYTITLDGNGISLSTVITVTFDSAIPTITQPTRTGYTFTNWNTQANNSGQTLATGETYQIANNITLFAIWAENQYTLTLYHNDGTGEITTIIVTFDSPIGTIIVPTRIGYDFAGWFTQLNGMGTEYNALSIYDEANDMTLYANWGAETFQITLDLNTENATISQTTLSVVYNQVIGVIPTASKIGYTNISWNTHADGSGITYDENTIYVINGNLKLYAIWAANQYTITFDPQGGTLTDLIITVTFNDVITQLVDAIKVGSDFNGWNMVADGSGDYINNGDIFTIANNIVLFAIYDVQTYLITFDPQGGTSVSSKLVTYGLVIGILDVSTRQGYEFSGWYTQRNGLGVLYNENTVYLQETAITLYAHWTANQYTIDFEGNGGTVNTAQITVSFAQNIPNIIEPSRAGYTFVRWNTSQANIGITITGGMIYEFTQNIQVFAIWAANTYTLTLNAQNGTTPETRIVTFGQPIGSIIEPTNAGYSFVGWNENVNGSGNTYTASTIYEVIGNLTLYAQWTERQYTVTFNPNLGEIIAGPASVEVLFNAVIGTFPVVERIGYDFIRWNTQANGLGQNYNSLSTLTEARNIILFAIWEIKTFILEFDTAGGDVIGDITIVYNAIMNLPTPTRDGYEFLRWVLFDDNSVIVTNGTRYIYNNNIKILAIWSAADYYITFDSQGGTPIEQIPATHDAPIGLMPITTRAGYTFVEWNTQSDRSGLDVNENTIYDFASDITLFAIWQANTYTLTFNSQGGSNIANRSVVFNTAIGSITAITRAGYVFERWNSEANGNGLNYEETTIYIVADDITIYAIWGLQTYEITLDAQGGAPDGQIHEVTYTRAVGNMPLVSKEGFRFAGWYTQPNAAGSRYTETTTYDLTTNLTLYAHWTPAEYILSFDTQGGSSHIPVDVAYNQPIPPLPTPTRVGYAFVKWNSAANGSGIDFVEGQNYSLQANTIAYAIWNAQSFNINFDTQGGVGIPALSVVFNEQISGLPTTTKLGYDFDGWYTQPNAAGSRYTDGRTYNISDDLTLYAAWAAKTFTITLDADGGTPAISTAFASYQAEIGMLPIPAKAAYQFSGWFTALNGMGTQYRQGDIYDLTNDITLYAYWELADLVITFDYQGGLNVDNIFTYNIAYGRRILSLPTTTRDGYTFISFNTMPDGSGTTYLFNDFFYETTNITLYATWQALAYNIFFNSMGGDSVSSIPVIYNQLVGQLPIAVKDGTIFNGWYSQQNGQGTRYTSETRYLELNDIMLYAYYLTDLDGDGIADQDEENDVIYLANIPNGTTSNIINLSNAEKVRAYTTYTISTQIPLLGGWIFNSWEVLSGNVVINLGTFTMGVDEVVLQAIWIPVALVLDEIPADLSVGKTFSITGNVNIANVVIDEEFLDYNDGVFVAKKDGTTRITFIAENGTLQTIEITIAQDDFLVNIIILIAAVLVAAGIGGVIIFVIRKEKRKKSVT